MAYNYQHGGDVESQKASAPPPPPGAPPSYESAYYYEEQPQERYHDRGDDPSSPLMDRDNDDTAGMVNA